MHLIGLGHRRLGIIGGLKHDPMSFDVPKARHRGFASALAEVGLELDPDLVTSGNFDIDGGREAMGAMLDLAEPPTAVFAMSDEMAFGALMALRERGLEPADDVSVVGVDDHEFSRVVELTTIHQPVSDHGSAAARALMNAMADGDSPVPHLRPPVELVVRATTAAPRSGPNRSVPRVPTV